MVTHAEQVVDRPSRSRPRWLLPALAAAAGAAILLYLGILTPSSLLYIGLVGGMIGMHLFGHGAHGGHGGHDAHEREDAAGSTPVVTSEDGGQAQHRGCH